jgi:hypothetical protein
MKHQADILSGSQEEMEMVLAEVQTACNSLQGQTNRIMGRIQVWSPIQDGGRQHIIKLSMLMYVQKYGLMVRMNKRVPFGKLTALT